MTPVYEIKETENGKNEDMRERINGVKRRYMEKKGGRGDKGL